MLLHAQVNSRSVNGLEMVQGRMELFDGSKDYTAIDELKAAKVRNKR